MSCHIRDCVNKIQMGLLEVSLGVIPGYGVLKDLQILLEKEKALELITTAGMVAEEAFTMGIGK